MGSDEGKKKRKSKSKKRNSTHPYENVELLNAVEEENKKNKPTEKKKRRKEKGKDVDDVGNAVQVKIQDNSVKPVGGKKTKKSKKTMRGGEENSSLLGAEVEDVVDKQTEAKSKKSQKEKKNLGSLKEDDNFAGRNRESDQNGVYFIASQDEDSSKGMKKWITEYHQSRPGLKVLQQRIDEFIASHEARLEQERKEREALAAEGGWTVVVHHKGRKKTTDSESGIAVGSVAQAAVEDKMTKKKKKEVGLDFYRFQRKEARMNEIMMLQSKFEQDRKRIQQLRAARKFRPY